MVTKGMRVECFFPADEPTDAIVRRIAVGDGVQVSGRCTCPSS